MPRDRWSQVLKHCGNDLSRENIMKQAANIKDLELPMLLPGMQDQHLADQLQPDPTACSSPSSTAKSWQLFGDLITA